MFVVTLMIQSINKDLQWQKKDKNLYSTLKNAKLLRAHVNVQCYTMSQSLKIFCMNQNKRNLYWR